MPDAGTDSVTVYSRTADGNIAPLRTLQGAATGLSLSRGLALDLTNNELFVSNADVNSVTVYSRTASGNTAPLRTLQGAATGLSVPHDPALAVCTPPPSGMVSWWGGDGNANDIIGTNHGTLVNGATFAPGMVGQAFSFDGVNDRVEAPAGVGDFGSSPFTVDLWMRSNSNGSHDNPTFILGKNHANGGLGWDIRQGDNTIRVVGVNGWGFNITSDASATPNVWHHIALTSTDTTVNLYIDGALKGTSPRSTITSTVNPFRIGYTTDFGSPAFNGLIDEVEIFNRALSAEEIAAIYNAGSAGKCAPAVPDAFSFIDQTGVPLSTVIASAPVQITGINATTNWTAGGGTACVSSANGCACDVAGYAASGTILNNQYMCARHTSSGAFSTATDTLVTVGGVSDTFTSTTLASDTTPGGFTFIDQTNVPLSTLITSAPVQITGINTTTNWTASGGTACVSSGNNCGCDVATYAASGNILNNQYMCARHTSSSNYSTATNTLVTVGGVSDTFTSTTLATPVAPPGPPDPDPALVYLLVNGGIGYEFSVANPVAVTYQLRGCQGQEMFLVLNAPPMGIVWSYLDAAGLWVKLPANLADITPFNATGPGDGTYPLFTGNAPVGDYDLYLGCDFMKNGHLDYYLGWVDGVYAHIIVHVR